MNGRNKVSLHSVITNLLFLYLQFFLFFEVVNGVAIFYKIQPLQAAIAAMKLLFFICFCLYVMLYSRRDFFLLILLFFLLMAALLGQVVFFPEGVGMPSYDLNSERGSQIIRTIQISIKIALNLLAAYFVVSLFNKGRYSWLKRIVYSNNGVLLLNFVFAFCGVGFSNYKAGEGATFGGTGFFYAGNEVGVALIMGVCSILVVNRNKKNVALALLYGLVGGFAIMSKVAIFGVLLIIVFHLYFSDKKKFILVGALFLVGASVVGSLLYSYFEPAINRWIYFIDRSSLEVFLLGGEKRVYYSSLVISNIGSSFPYFLVGGGWTGYPENNLFDLIDAFGLLGYVVFSIWAWILLKDVRFRFFFSESPTFKTVMVIAFLLLFVSVVAGHSIQSSLVLPFLGFVASKAWQRKYI